MAFTFAGRYVESLLSKGVANRASVLPTTPVIVRLSDGVTLASLYTGRTKAAAASNPAVTDSNGNLDVWADPGDYLGYAVVGGVEQAAFPIRVEIDPTEADAFGTAVDVAFTPAGGVAATNVQTAIVELDTEKQTAAQVTAAVVVHESDASAAHAASAVAFTPAGTIAATNVQAAIEEAASESGSSLTVENEGSALATAAGTLDFVGAGVTASGAGAEKTITVPGGILPNNNIGIGVSAVDSLTTGTNNIGLGTDALTALQDGANNVAVGYLAGKAMTAGNHNVLLGAYAGTAMTTANLNIAIGLLALAACTTGAPNIGIGYNALNACTTGSGNTGVGWNTLAACTGLYNTALGQNTLAATTTGEYNVAIGIDALAVLGASNDNTAVGSVAGKGVTTGEFQTFVGSMAGYMPGVGMVLANATTTADGQTLVGWSAGQGSATQRDYITALGFAATVDGVAGVALGKEAVVGAAHTNSVALGAGTTTTAANQVMVGAKDIEITDTAKGLVIKSPDGTRYRIQVANGGALSAVAA